RELASMVHFQIGRDLPFRLDEAVVDFKVRRPSSADGASPEAATAGLGTAAETKLDAISAGKLEVLVAAARREVVEFYRQTADAAGLKLTALGLLSDAHVRCVEACRVADGDQAFALVSLRPEEVSIEIIAWQSLLFSRGASIKLGPVPEPTASVSAPASETTEDSASADKPESLLSTEPPRPTTFAEAASIEVIRTLHSYSGMQSQNPATKVVVTGATGQEAAVVESLGKRLSIPCTLLDPATAFELPAESREQANGSLAAIGLALG